MALVILLGAVMLAFQYKPVQTWAAKKATAYLSKKLNTTVDIKSLYIKPFSSVVLDSLYVLDKQKDTLLNTPKLTIDLFDFSIFSSLQNHTIDFKNIQLDNGSVYIKSQADSTTNFKFILDAFKSTDTVKTVSKPWNVNFEKVTLNNMHFRYKNQLSKEVSVDHINFNDIDVKRFSVVLTDIDLKHHLFKAGINNLNLNEKSGFDIKKLSADATVDTNQIVLKNLDLVTNRSYVKDYFKMSFRSFDDFSDFENKVHMDADFKSSRISSLDVGYFTIALNHVFFDVGIDGRVKGPVNNLKAKNLTVTAGQATYVKGDFNLKGLPHWDNTFLELKFDQIASNKTDLDLLYSRFSGHPNSHVPDVIKKFGNFNFSGQFSGFQNDFVAFGQFKTKLGRFSSDINLKISKAGVPSYSGKVNAFDLDLATLVDNDLLGRTTFAANVKGHGFDLKDMSSQLDAKLAYFDLKGYRYKTLSVNGTFDKKKFVGALQVNDANLDLDFSGDVDLSQKLPVYGFFADIKRAKLNELKLIKDTVTIDAQLTSNFSGTNISNIDGSILLKNIDIQKPAKNYLIDSVYFTAAGKDNNRQLTLQSDVAAGSLKGSYDLGTLPDYFKTIAKKYIPSLKYTAGPVKPQNFQFNLEVRNLEPITSLFAPQLSLPDRGTFIGNFNSVERTATLTGAVKTVKYNNIVFHDLIIDESTSDDLLDFNVAINKINFSDSLFVKDINITNFLKNDNLNFNVKLSDKDAVNQLDLYGLIRFARNSTAQLSLLPSDVILENKVWKLQEQVQIKIAENGRTQINGFELSNGPQKVKIDGAISSDPADALNIVFEKFNMNTLDQLTKRSGITLNGTLNGKVSIASLTKKPGLESDLRIDSLAFNNSMIGDVKFNTKFDGPDNVLNTKVNVFNKGLETLNASGTYDLNPTDNTLDFVLKMNQTQAIILEPVVKSLVSNLKGAISSDLTLTGTLSKPLINGTLTFVNTGLTVNYLKTAYVINDKVSVSNTLVNISELSLKDEKGGEGIANGTVDLSKDITNPVLNVNVKARNLMALNTTFKDNRLYYGTAFGTGDFSFTGPIDNMAIDIKAKTEAGTIFNIPLNSSSTASDYDFIRYIDPKDSLRTVKFTNSFKGVTLNFDLTADEKTTVKIYTDYGVITGNGTANNLKINISSLGDFGIVGSYLISTGKFEFTAKSVISKLFQISQGGTINWTGDPTNSTINLKATYDVSANIQDLYAAAGLKSPKGTQYELVQAELGLSGSIVKPAINFDFNFPTDPSVKEDLQTYLSDNTNRSQQAVSLIVRRQFAAPSSGNGLNNVVGSTAAQAASEYFFNQVNNLFAQSNIKGVDINIRSTQQASATFHLFNDRLLLNGSLFSNTGNGDLFGTSGNNAIGTSNTQTLLNSSFNNLTKDVGVQYLIRKDGRLTATYSYRVLNNTTLGTVSSTNSNFDVEYVNGFGLVYRRDFDTFGEFFSNIFGGGRKTPAKRDSTNISGNPAAIVNKNEEDN